MVKILGFEIFKSKEYQNINKKLLSFENKIHSLRPPLDFLERTGMAGVRIPYYTLPMETLYDMVNYSDVLTNVVKALRDEMFRNGWEFEEKFTKKCPRCKKEFDFEAQKCDECGSEELYSPDYTQITELKKQFETKVNLNNQTLVEVLEMMENDINTVDIQYLVIIKDYIWNSNNEIIGARIREIVRGDPRFIRMITDDEGRFGRNEEGREVFVCPEHREKLMIEEEICPVCQKRCYPAYYGVVTAGEESPMFYYIKGEVIHNSKYDPSLTYGFPPVLTVWQKTLALMEMDKYIKDAYGRQRSPKGVLLVNTSNQNALEKAWNWLLDKTRLNPHMIWPFGVPANDGAKTVGQFIDFMKPLTEMQYIETRNEFRRSIGAVYGVMPLWQADITTSGGLNQEGLQITVTNRAVQKGQDIYNKKLFPKLLENFGVTDFVLKLLPTEEKDEMAELQREELKIRNATMMYNMGFIVKLNEKNEFEFEEPEGGIKPFQGMDILSPQPQFPRPQRFEGEPESVRRSIKKKRIYIQPGESAPPGVTVHTGERGGRYYESEETKITMTNIPETKVKSSLDELPRRFTEGIKIGYADRAKIDLNTKKFSPAEYRVFEDKILIRPVPYDNLTDEDIKGVIAHEIGHRVWFKFGMMSPGQKVRFIETYGKNWDPKKVHEDFANIFGKIIRGKKAKTRREKIVEDFFVKKSLDKDHLVHIHKILLRTIDKIEKSENLNIITKQDDIEDMIKEIEESVFERKFEDLTREKSDQIKKIIIEGILRRKSIPMIKQEVIRIVGKTFPEGSLETILRTESQAIQNKIREVSYAKADPEKTFRYKWINPMDNRTTEICRTLVTRTRNGVDINTLKRLIQEEGRKGGFEPREFTPHINCRSTFVRIV